MRGGRFWPAIVESNGSADAETRSGAETIAGGGGGGPKRVVRALSAEGESTGMSGGGGCADVGSASGLWSDFELSITSSIGVASGGAEWAMETASSAAGFGSGR